MIRYYRNTYINATVELDNNYYEGCTFTSCILVFKANAEVGLVDCQINNCKWSFEGPAANTIVFLTGLYHGIGPVGVKLVEDLFNNIRIASDVRKEVKPK